MAENIFFPNTTQVPNYVFDKLMSKCVKHPARLFVLLSIIRKTYGWQKQEDLLSLSQIIGLTGLSKNAVKESLIFWQKEKVIKLLSKGSGRKISQYRCLLYDYIDNQRVIEKLSEGQPVILRGSISDTLEGQPVTPQKQLNQSTKPIIQKKEQISFSASQDKVEIFQTHHKARLKESRLHGDPDLFLLDKLGQLVDWNVETYDKILNAKKNSKWDVRRNQPNTARWLLATLENENLELNSAPVYRSKWDDPEHDAKMIAQGFI